MSLPTRITREVLGRLSGEQWSYREQAQAGDAGAHDAGGQA
jgi:hypothetical protein